MQPYLNLSGNSGVVAFAADAQSIIVRFKDGLNYEYTTESAGAAAIAEMKRRAITGRDLSTYISREVKDKYARKFR